MSEQQYNVERYMVYEAARLKELEIEYKELRAKADRINTELEFRRKMIEVIGEQFQLRTRSEEAKK